MEEKPLCDEKPDSEEKPPCDEKPPSEEKPVSEEKPPSEEKGTSLLVPSSEEPGICEEPPGPGFFPVLTQLSASVVARSSSRLQPGLEMP